MHGKYAIDLNIFYFISHEKGLGRARMQSAKHAIDCTNKITPQFLSKEVSGMGWRKKGGQGWGVAKYTKGNQYIRLLSAERIHSTEAVGNKVMNHLKIS